MTADAVVGSKVKSMLFVTVGIETNFINAIDIEAACGSQFNDVNFSAVAIFGLCVGIF